MRLTFGSITVDSYSDGELACPLLAMLPDARPGEIRRMGGCDDGETLKLPMTSYLIRSGGRTVLVDTGIGPELGSLGRAFTGEVGKLPAALADAQIDLSKHRRCGFDALARRPYRLERLRPRRRTCADVPECRVRGQQG